MNNGAFDSSFKMYADPSTKSHPDENDVEMGHGGPNGGAYGMDMFAQEVENVKEDVKELEKLYVRIQESNEDVKVAQNAMGMRELRDDINADLDHIMKLAKLINKKFDGLIRANAAQRRATGPGPGSLTDDARASMISELGESIQAMMRKFQGLRVQMETDHRQLIESRYFAITREKATAEAIDNLISNEVVVESPLHQAMQDHGRGPVLDAVAEIQERRGAMMEIRRSLMALHQVLLGIASPVTAAAGDQRGGPPSPVVDAFTSPVGAHLPIIAKPAGPGGLNDYEKETRSQAYVAIGVSLFVIILTIVGILLLENYLENKIKDDT